MKGISRALLSLIALAGLIFGSVADAQLTRVTAGGTLSCEMNPADTCNLTWPTTVNNTMLAALTFSYYEGGGPFAPEAITGFTLRSVDTSINGTGSAESRVAIYTSELAGTETGTLAVNLDNGSSYATVILDVFDGTSDLTFVSATAGSVATGTTTATIPSVSGTSGQGLIGMCGTSDPTTMTTPMGMTAGTAGLQNANTGRHFFETLVSTAATGAKTSTLGTSRDSVCFAVLINGASAGGGGSAVPVILQQMAANDDEYDHKLVANAR